MGILAAWNCKQCILQFPVLCLRSTYYILCKLVDLLNFHHQCYQMSFSLFLSLLEIFICDKAFCFSFIVVRVVLLSFFWLLYITTWTLKMKYVISMWTMSINSSNIVMLMKLSLSPVATHSCNLREFTISWWAADRTFTVTLTKSIGLISFMICFIELILRSSFFCKYNRLYCDCGKVILWKF